MIDPLYTVSGFAVGTGALGVAALTPLAGAGYWYLGAVDWVLLGSLLSGSVPGVLLGSLLATRVPISVVRGTLAATLVLVAGKLLA